ncbi:MAG: hypothetical protein WD851_19785 [Pirellulales bacterium]
MRIRLALFTACTWMFATISPTPAQQPIRDVPPTPAVDAEENWSYEQNYTPKPNPRAIIQQKAQIRAAQRMDRMAAMQWYGMSNSRPTASATPFSTMYSPAWQVPGGRPFGWFHSQRAPVIIVR